MGLFDNVEAQEELSGGNFAHVTSGAYVCRITSAELGKTKNGKTRFECLFDIDEGALKDFFSDSYYDNKPFRHNFLIMMDGSALGIVKHIGLTLDRSNPQNAHFLDALGIANEANTEESVEKKAAANEWLAKNLPGALIGIVLQERIYTYNGKEQHEALVYKYVDVADVKAGKIKAPETIDDREVDHKLFSERFGRDIHDITGKNLPKPTKAIPEDDIPF